MEVVESAENIVRIVFVLLYAAVGFIGNRWLIPRLSAACGRVARLMLAAQLLAISVWLFFRPSAPFDVWLWNVDGERNVAGTLASAQLALVAIVALMTLWRVRKRLGWRSLYLFGIGLLFLYFARDEFFEIHEFVRDWRKYYAAIGVLLAAATVLLAARSPRRARLWHICFLAGLAISAAGAIALEGYRYPWLCGRLGLMSRDTCLISHIEEYLEFLGIWLALIAMLGHFSDAAQTAGSRAERFLYLAPLFWITLLAIEAGLPYLEARRLAQPANVAFESTAQLHGYQIRHEESALRLRLYTTVKRTKYRGMGLSVHLVDQASTDSVASLNAHWGPQIGRLIGPGQKNIHRQWLTVELPSRTPVNRALWVVLAFWREQDDEFLPLNVLSSDRRLLGAGQVILGELVIPAAAEIAPGASLADFDNGFALEAVELPRRAQPGDSLSIRFSWRSSADSSEDLVQFLHFVGEEDGAFWGFDQEPLGPRLPTRLWYAGLGDSEVWTVPLPEDIAAGPYHVYTGLYRRSDLARIPARDRDGNLYRDASLPLGALIIER